jgi:glycosyltransferase involved in cell wall biosynthesis
MKVCHVTTAHPAEDIRIFHKECVSLAEAGHEVFLLVAGTGDDRIEKGVRIIHVPVYYKSRPGRMFRAPWALVGKIFEIDPDVVHFHDPEFLPVTRKLQRKGICVIYDIHEDLPRQILSKYWIPGSFRKPLARFVEHYENRVAARLNHLIVTTPHIAERFHPLSPDVSVVRNFPLQHEFTPVEASRKPHPPHLCYAGGITAIRGSREMVAAIEHLDVVLDLAGPVDSCDQFQELRKLPGWTKKIYHGVVDRQIVAGIMGRAYAGLNLMHPVPNYIDAIPTKLFEYMLSGIPVIASNFPSWAAIIERYDCGICVDPLNVQKISEAIKFLLDHPERATEMGKNGHRAALENFSWDSERKVLWLVYASLEMGCNQRK